MDAIEQLSAWIDAGRPMTSIAAAVVVAVCFVVFNAVRVLLYVPQLVACCRDTGGCAGISVFTWSSWVVANASTGLYMWMFLGDLWGLLLNLGNALMCAATVAVTLTKRRRHASASPQPSKGPDPGSTSSPRRPERAASGICIER